MAYRIETAMAAAKFTQTSLAEVMGVTPQAVQQWVSGQTAPRGKRLEQLAKILDVSLNWLLTGKNEYAEGEVVRKFIIDQTQITDAEKTNVYEINRNLGKVPLINSVRAGEWCEVIDNYHQGDAEEWMECPKIHSRYAYALRVEGDSMTSPYPGQRSYPEGVIIFVDPDIAVTSGCRVVAKLPYSDRATFKEYREENGKRYLKPLNPQYPIMEITDETRICGVVIGQFVPE